MNAIDNACPHCVKNYMRIIERLSTAIGMLSEMLVDGGEDVDWEFVIEPVQEALAIAQAMAGQPADHPAGN